jgi:hypothetical protein
MLGECEVDEVGLRKCPIWGFGTNDVEHSTFGATESVCFDILLEITK